MPSTTSSIKASDQSIQTNFDESSNQKSEKYHPGSKWEEPRSHHQPLTLWEIHRPPIDTVHDHHARISMPLKDFSTEFHCPVCLGYMKKTHIVMECLHRFCGECIQKCLRLGKKECPSCRIHIPSRRSLRPDLNFDLLIRNLYGDIEALEKQEEVENETLNKAKNMNNAYAESRRLGIMQQAVNRRKSKPQPTGWKRRAPNKPTIFNLEESPLIDFVLRRHPQETLVDRLYREHLRTNNEITMKFLKKFLGQKLSYENFHLFQILTVAGGRPIVLDDPITLADVKRDIADVHDDGSVLVLQYRIFPIPTSHSVPPPQSEA
eukprot:CAMPEP_0184859694 /NCGR_PEP_ID=MMETSP0580-20130426/4687_1 /TAXON_ID=1118495 /ORGANISM="Dactyliosolen fragilissimus" /LENGTH=319 /DNA_ID=CAMNT_0027356479 /DNA_START=144 /DNA_END=1103 /DNA_ORIENTATION=-